MKTKLGPFSFWDKKVLFIYMSEIEDKILNLFKSDSASHAYIFFGDNQVGKFTFAKSLANFLEFNEFKQSTKPLSETLIIKPIIEETKSSIGIDKIKEIRSFLYQKPTNSKYRLVIIDDAYYLTEHAQNAILKIAEEPPAHGVIIMILPNPDALLETIKSRFQKIYFPRLSEKEVKIRLIEEFKIDSKEAEEVSKKSFGRIGRAIDLIRDEEFANLDKEAEKLIMGKTNWQDVAKSLAELENRQKIDPFMENLIARLALDPVGNLGALKAISERINIMSTTSANKRLQMEAGLIAI